jgi:hypothetical protein
LALEKHIHRMLIFLSDSKLEDEKTREITS